MEISCEQDEVKMIAVFLGEWSFKLACVGHKYFIKVHEKQVRNGRKKFKPLSHSFLFTLW